MKKFFAFALALALTLALSVTCFAALENKTGDVTATYKTPDPAGTVYKVDVVFGDMEFTYTPEGNGTWDPAQHKYVEKAAAKWEATGNTITVTNHSNAAVTVTLSYDAEEGFEAATATFSKTTFTLDSAATTGAAVADSATLTMDGTLPASATTATKIGTVTVALQ